MKKKIYLLKIIVILLIIIPKNCFSYSKAVVDITSMDVFEIQKAIDDGYLTYELLTKLYLERIEAYDKDFHSIISINENAILEAKECDKKYKKEGRNSIFFGIPIIVKDNIDVKNMPTTCGTLSLQNSYPKEDAKIISNLKSLGAIILAKSNMSEFAFYASNSLSSYQDTRNSYNLDYTSYGSSSGSCVAVSNSFSPVAIGTDTNASTRLPAVSNNVIGMRPTFNAISTDGIVKYDVTRDTVGIITKTVKENAYLYEALNNNISLDYDISDYSLSGVRVGIIKKMYEDLDYEVKPLVDKTLDNLKSYGVTIVSINEFPYKKYQKLDIDTMAGWTFCNSFNSYIKNTNSNLNNFFDLLYDKGHITSLWSYTLDCGINIDKVKTYDNIKKELYDNLIDIYKDNTIDFIIYPTSKNKVLKIEDDNNLKTDLSLLSSVFGLPDISFPIGSDKDNLYYGMDLVGLKNSDSNLYKFLYQYQKLNNTYQLSELAKPLYNVSDKVLELKKEYEKYRNIKILEHNKNYKKVKKEIEDFLFNYNSYEDNSLDEKATNLLKKHTYSLNNIYKIYSNYLIFIVFIILIILILKIIKKKEIKVK